jgi:peptidoglycan LD-endopeptidase CwlK
LQLLYSLVFNEPPKVTPFDPLTNKTESTTAMIISNQFVRALLLLTLVLTAMPLAGKGFAQSSRTGTSKHPIVDSRMTEKEAFDGLDPKCPAEIRKRQKVVKLKYYSSDGKIHQGQLVIDGELKNDIKKVFALALKERFPIYSVIPISDERFRKDDNWDDELSMEANNASAFNYREITGGGRLSNHAYGRAIDINTFQNPYIKGSIVLPHGAKYDPSIAGTFTSDHPIVRAFLRLGWDWGGNWTSPKDYQHFEKPMKKK